MRQVESLGNIWTVALKPGMLQELEKTNKFDVVEFFLYGQFSQSLSIIPDSLVGDTEDI